MEIGRSEMIVASQKREGFQMKTIKQGKQRGFEASIRVSDIVSEMIRDVRERGDAALQDYSLRFDQCSRDSLRVGPDEIKAAYAQVSEQEIQDLKEAAAHIRTFAQAQRDTLKEMESFQISEGACLGHRVIPVGSCCCYVPGGNYPLYSTALMLIIPAKVAGVARVTACSPAKKGTAGIHPHTLVAMDIAGADEIYTVGGAQAIAAFSYGTEQIAPVDLIVGPGNQYVTEAKRQCFGKVGIDFIAGPSEVLVLADDSADARIIAADLLAQCEHDRAAQGILVTTSENLAETVTREIRDQLSNLETAAVAADSWETYGTVILADSLREAIQIANRIAPEHLELALEDPDAAVKELYNYGSLFIGTNTAEVFGDYASGTNHTLPTMGAARYTGGVWAGTFLKVCTHQRMTEDAMRAIAPLASRMARGEGLISHAHAAEFRMEKSGRKE